jgi:glycosyltransferase involved in cell wall biosynthesis
MVVNNGRRRLAVVTWFYDDQPGFLDFRYRIEALGRHHDVTLVLRDGRFATEFTASGLTPMVVAQPASGTRSLFRYLWQVSRLLRADPHDAVVLLGAQLAPACGLLGRVPVALYWNEHPAHTFHGGRWGWVSAGLAKVLVSLAYASARRAALVMPIGEAHHDDLIAHGVAPQQIQLIPMGVDERFARLAATRTPRAEKEPLSVIYTGTVQHERGRDVMLDGFALARQRGAACRLTLVGASDVERDYCLRRGAALGIADVLTVVGRVPGDAIPDYLWHADAGICAWEDRIWWRFNPPTKLFEYLAAGLPVLASRIRTHTLYLVDGESGLIFDYEPHAFADALLRLCATRGRWLDMAQAAARAGEQFLWPQIEPRFLRAMESLH